MSHDGPRSTPLRGAAQETTTAATRSPIAAPSLPAAPPPPGRARSHDGPRKTPLPLGLPGHHESEGTFADRSPQGTARSHDGPRKTPLRWASQETTKVATVSQIAAPKGRRGLEVVCVRRRSAGPPRSSRKWRHLRRSQPPRGRRGLVLVCVGRHSAGPPRSPRKRRRQFFRSQPPGAPRARGRRQEAGGRWEGRGGE